MGQPWLNIVKAICSLIAALIYAPVVIWLMFSSFSLCFDCAGIAGLIPLLGGWLGPASIIFLILVEVDKPSPWDFLRRHHTRSSKLQPGSLTSYGAIVIALLSGLGFIFGCAYLHFFHR